MVSAYRNPTNSQISKLIKQSGFLRAVGDHQSGDIYVWPGDQALHEEGIRQLGLSDMTENLGQVTSADDWKKLLTKNLTGP